MNTRPPHDARVDAFDARLREIHAGAVAATPARVRLQLRPRRDAIGAHVSRHGWSLAAAFALALVAAGLLWQRPSPPATPSDPQRVATAPAAVAPAAEPLDLDEAYAALDESPDLYLWLASSDASALLDSDPPDAFDGARGDGVTR